MINTLWFVVLAVMLAGYAVLDGFDLGVGVLHLLRRRDDREERGRAIDAIGPVWNGNEVWLLAAGGAMVVAVPAPLRGGFSGFYLRADARPLAAHPARHRRSSSGTRSTTRSGSDALGRRPSRCRARCWPCSSAWRSATCCAACRSTREGNFQGSFALLLNPFALLGGVLSLVALALHGAAYLAMKTDGALQQRAPALDRAALVRHGDRSWPRSWRRASSCGPTSRRTSPAGRRCRCFRCAGPRRRSRRPGLRAAGRRHRARSSRARRSSSRRSAPRPPASTRACCPASPAAAHAALDIYNAASSPTACAIALAVYLVGMALVGVYLVTLYRVWRGKTTDIYHR